MVDFTQQTKPKPPTTYVEFSRQLEGSHGTDGYVDFGAEFTGNPNDGFELHHANCLGGEFIVGGVVSTAEPPINSSVTGTVREWLQRTPNPWVSYLTTRKGQMVRDERSLGDLLVEEWRKNHGVYDDDLAFDRVRNGDRVYR